MKFIQNFSTICCGSQLHQETSIFKCFAGNNLIWSWYKTIIMSFTITVHMLTPGFVQVTNKSPAK